MELQVRGVLAGIAVALVLAAVPAWAEGVSTACDRLAASPYDPAVPRGEGVGLGEIDTAAAIAACTDAVAADPASARLKFQLARAYDAAEQFDKALAGYRAAADQGSALALSALGSLYESGLGVDADPAAAAEFYQRAADAGLILAVENLAKLYEDGRGVPQDYARAAALYRQAAEAGSPYGAGSLGWLVENGHGVPRDETEAVRLYQIAADGGEAFAQHNMGVMYAAGRGGLARSDAKAIQYYELAAAQHWAPSYSSLAWHYSHGAGVTRDIAKAEAYLRLAIGEGDAKVQGDARNDLAWLFATENIHLEEAEQLARDAVAAGPEVGNRLDTLAWILHLTGRDKEALPLAQKALSLETGNAAFADHLAGIEAALGQ